VILRLISVSLTTSLLYGAPTICIIELSHPAFSSCELIGADDRLEAILAALAVFPRLGVEAANHAHAAPFVEGASALLGQLSHASTVVHSASTIRSPASFRPPNRLVATWQLQTAVPDDVNRCSGSAPIQLTSSTWLYGKSIRVDLTARLGLTAR
jgi:hypothetical protein